MTGARIAVATALLYASTGYCPDVVRGGVPVVVIVTPDSLAPEKRAAAVELAPYQEDHRRGSSDSARSSGRGRAADPPLF